MGGKGGSQGTQPRTRFAQGATGERQQTGNQNQRRSSQRSMQPQTPQRQPSERDRLRIPENDLQNLYAPSPKANPQAPMPARIGVRAERRAYNPTLAIPQKDIDALYGYGPTYAIPERDINQLYGTSTAGGDSLLGDDDYDPITGEVF